MPKQITQRVNIALSKTIGENLQRKEQHFREPISAMTQLAMKAT
jgi:hypothetical protein